MELSGEPVVRRVGVVIVRCALVGWLVGRLFHKKC